jgi:hypothetical protein
MDFTLVCPDEDFYPHVVFPEEKLLPKHFADPMRAIFERMEAEATRYPECLVRFGTMAYKGVVRPDWIVATAEAVAANDEPLLRYVDTLLEIANRRGYGPVAKQLEGIARRVFGEAISFDTVYSSNICELSLKDKDAVERSWLNCPWKVESHPRSGEANDSLSAYT